MDNILDKQIDESVADYVLTKVEKHIDELNSQYAATERNLSRAYEAKQNKLFATVDKIVAEEVDAIKEEYSARYLTKIEELNSQIAEKEEEKELFKSQLSERVNTFLSNSKDEVRTVVEEEMRLDSEVLKANHLLDEMRSMLGVSNTPSAAISSVDETKVIRLGEDIEVLRERLESKSTSVRKLRAQFKVYELCESVPSTDREFFVSQLSESETVDEAEEKFGKIKSVIRKRRTQLLEDELSDTDGRGSLDEEEWDVRPQNQPKVNHAINRMKNLAGINN